MDKIRIWNNSEYRHVPSCSIHIIELVKGFIKTMVANQKIPNASHLACWFAAFNLHQLNGIVKQNISSFFPPTQPLIQLSNTHLLHIENSLTAHLFGKASQIGQTINYKLCKSVENKLPNALVYESNIADGMVVPLYAHVNGLHWNTHIYKQSSRSKIKQIYFANQSKESTKHHKAWHPCYQCSPKEHVSTKHFSSHSLDSTPTKKQHQTTLLYFI